MTYKRNKSCICCPDDDGGTCIRANCHCECHEPRQANVRVEGMRDVHGVEPIPGIAKEPVEGATGAREWLEVQKQYELGGTEVFLRPSEQRTIELLEAYASSQLKKLDGVAQQAAEKIVDECMFGDSAAYIKKTRADIAAIIFNEMGQHIRKASSVSAPAQEASPHAEGKIVELPIDFWSQSPEMQRGWLWKQCVKLQNLDELSRTCNNSLHLLISAVWKELDPTGEYEGDMDLVQFAKSLASHVAEVDRLTNLLTEARAQRDWIIEKCEQSGLTFYVSILAPVAQAYTVVNERAESAEQRISELTSANDLLTKERDEALANSHHKCEFELLARLERMQKALKLVSPLYDELLDEYHDDERDPKCHMCQASKVAREALEEKP